MPLSSLNAERATVGADCRIDPDSFICAHEVIVGRNVVIEPGVRISADRVEIGDGCRIRRNVSIVSPEVRMGTGTTLGEDSRIELNAHLRIGTLCDLGRRLRVVGQGVEAGDHLWLTDDITIGGGGARGPRAFLTIGNRSAMMDRCFVNLAEPVTIGDEAAFSNNVVVLTHSMWQSVLEGGTAKFGPVRIGSHVILYVNAVIAPGVTIGDHVTVAAAALVLRDVADGSLAVGNPARVLKAAPPYPRRLPDVRLDAIARELLNEYAAAIATKGATVRMDSPDTLEIVRAGACEIIQYLASTPAAPPRERPTITFAAGRARDDMRGRVHFDLASSTVEGEPTEVSEDFRDFLRRRSIRVFSDRPFQSLPLAEVARLKARLPPGA